jgi:hypothetical protein
VNLTVSGPASSTGLEPKGGDEMSNNSGAAAGVGAIYGVGILGAWVWFFQQADTFWGYVFAILQGILWPAWMVYDGFHAFG